MAKTILQKITVQISKATSANINVSDFMLKMEDSGLQGVSANAYQLQPNNLITCTVDFLSIISKSCTDLNQYRRDNKKDQFEPSLRKSANNVPAGSSILFEDDLAGRIRSLNNATSLMKPTKTISREIAERCLVKKPKKLPALPENLCLREERVFSPEQLILRSLFD